MRPKRKTNEGQMIPCNLLTTPYANIRDCAVILVTTQVHGKEDVLYVKNILYNKDEKETIPKTPALAAKLSNLAIFIFSYIKK